MTVHILSPCSRLVIAKAAKTYPLLAAALQTLLGVVGISNSVIHSAERARPGVGEPTAENATAYMILLRSQLE